MSAAETAELRAKAAKAAQLEAALKQQQQQQQRDGDEAACVVCMSNVKDHVAVPCGHMAMCGECCERLGTNKCPICRVEVQLFVKVYK